MSFGGRTSAKTIHKVKKTKARRLFFCRADIQSLFTRLTLEYQVCLTAYRRAQDPNFDLQFEDFRSRAEMMWMNVRGHRYQSHERQALEDVLTPHSDILIQLFGIDAPELIEQLDRILAKLTRGLHDLFVELKSFQDETLRRLETLSAETGSNDFDALQEKIFEDAAFSERREKIGGELLGLDLYDVEKICLRA